MKLDDEFSMEQSEELIAQLKTSSPSGFTQLHSTLKLLSHVSELSPVAMPPMLPSAVDQPIETISSRGPRAHRPVITSLIVTAVLASASFAAAGVTGRGPAVIVEAAQKSGEIVANVVGTVGNTLTGSTEKKTPPSGIRNSSPSITSTSATPPTPVPAASVKTPNIQQTTTSGSSSEDHGQSAPSGNSDDGEENHPAVTADPSPTPSQTLPPSNGSGLGGLVLPPVTNSQSQDDSRESENENHATSPTSEKPSKRKKSSESQNQNQSQTQTQGESENESD